MQRYFFSATYTNSILLFTNFYNNACVYHKKTLSLPDIMRKNTLHITLLFLLAIALPCHAEIIRGDNGENVNWTFNTNTGEFSLFGSGTKWESDSTQSLPWYDYLGEIRNIHIASDVSYIGAWAFAGCVKLTTFTLPSSVKRVGTGILYNTGGISEPIYNDSIFLYLPTNYSGPYVLPEGPRCIAGGAFFGCSELTTVKIPDTYTEIGEYAFSNCKKMMTITIKGNVKEIAAGTFDECSSLKAPKLPDSIIRIGENAFSGCVSFTSFVIPNGTEEIGEKAFALCAKLSSVRFPSSIQKICAHAFVYCDELHSVNIPNTSCKLERSSFPYHCTVTYK